MERELSGLQMQLKLSTGPKRSALMMLRKKIEVQNDRVLAARTAQKAAKKARQHMPQGSFCLLLSASFADMAWVWACTNTHSAAPCVHVNHSRAVLALPCSSLLC